MKCVNCGHENTVDAKSCGRCGAALTTGAAATSSATATASAIGAVPPAAGSERRIAKIIVLGALVILLGVGGYLGSKMFSGSMPRMPHVTTPAMEPPMPAPMPEPPKDAAPAAPATQHSSPPTAPPPAETEPMKAEPAPAAAPPRAAPAPAPKAAPKALASPPVHRAPATQAAPPTAAPQAAPAEAPRPDRWALMKQEMEACKREPFFNRVVCEQKVGQRYCAGYWGLVPECGGKAQ